MIVFTVPIIYNIIIGNYFNIISNILKVIQFNWFLLFYSAARFHLNFYFLTRIILLYIYHGNPSMGAYFAFILDTPKEYIIPYILLSLLNCCCWITSSSNKSAGNRSNFSDDIFCRIICMVNSNNNYIITNLQNGKMTRDGHTMWWQIYYNNNIM